MVKTSTDTREQQLLVLLSETNRKAKPQPRQINKLTRILKDMFKFIHNKVDSDMRFDFKQVEAM
jgi:hypothetical protein